MSRVNLKRSALVLLAGGMLVQVGGCLAAFGPALVSLGETTLLTYLFGRGF